MYFNFNEIMDLEKKIRGGRDDEASGNMIRAIGLQSLRELWRISLNYDIDAKVNLQSDIINIARTMYDLSIREIAEIFDVMEANVLNIVSEL